MKAIQTTLQLLTSAGLTGGMFALPLGLCLLGNAGIELAEIIQVEGAEERVVTMSLPSLPSLPEGADAPDAVAQESGSGASELTGGNGPAMGGAAEAVAGTSRGRQGGWTTVSKPVGEAVATRGKRKDCLPDNPAIDRESSDTWDVERSLLATYAKHPGRLDDLGWSARHKNDEGKADGFQIGGLQCGNDLHEAGLRSGDVVHTVNGRSVNNVPQALATYLALRKADTLEVEITRRGSRKTLTYTLS